VGTRGGSPVKAAELAPREAGSSSLLERAMLSMLLREGASPSPERELAVLPLVPSAEREPPLVVPGPLLPPPPPPLPPPPALLPTNPANAEPQRAAKARPVLLTREACASAASWPKADDQGRLPGLLLWAAAAWLLCPELIDPAVELLGGAREAAHRRGVGGASAPAVADDRAASEPLMLLACDTVC
jgi:hypothetical protein